MNYSKINLACGKDYRSGYLNIDDQSMTDGKVDLKANVFEYDTIPSSVDEILLSHFMMYIDTFDAPILFARWYQWLKQGGVLIIETGDLKKICRNILRSTKPENINGTNGVMQLFGWDNTKGHKWAWCEDTLRPLLEKVGFIIEEVKDGGSHNRSERDLTIIAKKL